MSDNSESKELPESIKTLVEMHEVFRVVYEEGVKNDSRSLVSLMVTANELGSLIQDTVASTANFLIEEGAVTLEDLASILGVETDELESRIAVYLNK